MQAQMYAFIKRFAHRHGHDGLYHETITYAFFFLINERIERDGRKGSWDAFAARNRDLVTRGKALLNNYYRAETLDSDLARKVFVMPELQPLMNAATADDATADVRG